MCRNHAAALAPLCLLLVLTGGFADDNKNPPPAADPQPRIKYQFDDQMRVGLTVIDEQGKETNITCGEDGGTNQTLVRIDGKDVEFGSAQGQWSPQQAPLGPGPDGKERRGHKSVWVCDNIHITQIVEIVPSQKVEKGTGRVKKSLDSCLIRYVIENKDKQPHTVGLRAMVDTMIDDNDGCPFAVPGKKDVITTSADFRTAKEVPAHVQVLENKDLQKPGFVAHLTLRVGGKLEAPSRFTITNWPGTDSGWEVPVNDIDEDSAVAIYWNPQEVRAERQA